MLYDMPLSSVAKFLDTLHDAYLHRVEPSFLPHGIRAWQFLIVSR